MKSLFFTLFALALFVVPGAEAHAGLWQYPWGPVPPPSPVVKCPRIFPPPCSCDYYHQNPHCDPIPYNPYNPHRPYPTPYPYPTFRPVQSLPLPEAQPPTYVPYPKYFPTSSRGYPVSHVQCLAPCYRGHYGQFVCPCDRIHAVR